MTKREFNILLKKNKLTIKDFSRLCEVSVNTITNWNGESKPIPKWVKSWFYLYEKSIKYDELLLQIKGLDNIR